MFLSRVRYNVHIFFYNGEETSLLILILHRGTILTNFVLKAILDYSDLIHTCSILLFVVGTRVGHIFKIFSKRFNEDLFCKSVVWLYLSNNGANVTRVLQCTCSAVQIC